MNPAVFLFFFFRIITLYTTKRERYALIQLQILQDILVHYWHESCVINQPLSDYIQDALC